MSDNIIDIDGISYFFVYEYYDNYECYSSPSLVRRSTVVDVLCYENVLFQDYKYRLD